MKSKKLLDRSAPTKLFKPRFRNSNDMTADHILKAPENIDKNNTQLSDTNIFSTSSFRYGDKKVLVSTQQVRIDYTKFENHTFFHSAVAKINEAMDKIVNFYPIDATKREFEKFEDDLTGYEKYVLDKFPKNIGYLNFSGTKKGEVGGKGTYISVLDGEGTAYPELASKKSARAVLDPKKKPFSISFHCKIPKITNENQVIIQKFGSLANNFTLLLSESSSTDKAKLAFGITSGSQYAFVTGSITKGAFTNVTVTYDPDGDGKTKMCIGDNFTSSSMVTFFDTLNYNAANLTIGTGQNARLNNVIYNADETFSGSIDDIRFVHKPMTIQDVKDQRYETMYATDDLKLYFKFNEPKGTYRAKALVLDSSKSGLHSKIINYLDVHTRVTGSEKPVKNELIERSPVLFPDFPDVSTLNTTLYSSASMYDRVNPNLITKLVPPHYFAEANADDGFSKALGDLDKKFTDVTDKFPNKGVTEIPSATLLVQFLLSYAKIFDELKILIDAVTAVTHTKYDDFDTTPDVFLHEQAKRLNIDLPPLFSTSNFAQLLNGVNLTEDYQNAVLSLNQIKNLIWRRILSDAVNMKTSKGTLDSIKSVFRSAGIEPDNILTFREYGGAKKRSLENSRQIKLDVLSFLNFSGSIGASTIPVDYQGFPTGQNPRLKSGFLSASRVEVGNPKLSGRMVQKSNKLIHGISNKRQDGFLTSGSFTYEGLYAWPGYRRPESLVRFNVTGSNATAAVGGVTTNLVATDRKITLFIRNKFGTAAPVHELFLTGVNVYDKDEWYISFGRENIHDAKTKNRSVYFLRAIKQENGEVMHYHNTSSHIANPALDLFSARSGVYNASGSFFTIGAQTFQGTSSGRYLNSSAYAGTLVHSTSFTGQIAGIKLWSKAITEREARAHAKNPLSHGVLDPKVNYNFTQETTGSFERIRIRTDPKQSTTGSDALGVVGLYDFSQNGSHLIGSGFEPNKTVFKPRQVMFEMLSENFDLNIAKTKVRVRSYQDEELFDDAGYATTAPVHNTPLSEEVFDDNRFSIDMSVQKGLNENIMRMFSDFSALDDALGRPNNVFGIAYKDLEQLRKIYFNNVLEKTDLGKFRNIFKWIDNSFTDIVFSMIPRSTNFMGINFIYESHVLERHKLGYLFDEIYLKALPRDPSRGNLLLSQFVANMKKF